MSRIFKKKKKEEEKEEEIKEIEEPEVEEPEVVEKEKEEKERFPLAEEFLKGGQDIFNARRIMRVDPHLKFALLGIVVTLVRPWKQIFDEYTIEQLKVLENIYKTELESVREALMRKIQ